MSSCTHTGDDCQKRSLICGLNRKYLKLAFQSLYFRVFVLYNSEDSFVAIVTSYRIMLNVVNSNAHKVIAGFFLSPDPEVT
jgi:hypothetical protein